ncbi:MAG TPA: hypothetical protein VET65_10295 [Candidatus Limnocylindrales bacterium]|nr:hypothetical protein [Candidatus Limnocylindrales bacterium]
MRRVFFYRLYDIEPARLPQLEAEAQAFSRSRDWRGDRFWLATSRSTDLFSMEYFRHARNEEGPALAAAGFLRLQGDETDAIATLYFLNDCSQQYHARAWIHDEDNPIAKLRHIEIRQGRLPSGMPIEDVLAARPVIKRMRDGAITFYPPTFHPNPYYRRDKPGMWGFSLQGMRDFAATFLEAEAEAMRIYRGLGRLHE